MSRCRLTVLCLLAGLAGCMEGQKSDLLSRTSLYDRLGGKDGITRIADDLAATAVEDRTIRPADKKQFDEEDVAALKKYLGDRIAAAAGAHRPAGGPEGEFKAAPVDFNALAGDLARALDRNDVGPAAKKELLDLLAPGRRAPRE
jgi:hypothetical protein